MLLKKVNISGFRSVTGTETLLVNEHATVLIGANDHGKSNVLEAVQFLNDDVPIKVEDRNWDLPANQEPKIEWFFTLDDQEVDELTAALGQHLAHSTSLVEQETWFKPGAITNEVSYLRKGTNTSVQVIRTPFTAPESFTPHLLALRPRVLLFNTPSEGLTDTISLYELNQNLVMQGIFRLAGIWEYKDTLFTYTSENSRRLDDASETLTRVLNEQWQQGRDLKWKLKLNSGSIEIEIKDPSISNRYSKPSLRSTGFRTYFLLSMMITAQTGSDTHSRYIFLFDEPGTYLHPHAQIDLQRSFATIAERSQILYSTHSIFLVNKNHPERNRVISKTIKGTQIDQKPFQKNWKSVRDSLGILFSNNFLIADKTLLVEGPSDVIYILNAIDQLKRSKQLDLDLNDFSIVDAGSAENYIAMGKLMLSEGRKVVALTDGDPSGKSMADKLERVADREQQSGLLTLIRLPEHASTEDIFTSIEVLFEAAKQVALDLVSVGIRVLKDPDIVWEDEIARLKTSIGASTLGYVLDAHTASWFVPAEKLSKLSIALKYEEIAKRECLNAQPSAKKWIDKIQSTLELRGESAFEEGIYEQASA